MITITTTWEETAERFSHVVDKLGKKIDEGIFETVVALNMLGITTRASCEGHLDWGVPYPWIDVEPVDETKYRLHRYLVQFYEGRPANFDSALAWQGYRLRSAGSAFSPLLSPEEQAQNLMRYRDEMRSLTTFLKSLI